MNLSRVLRVVCALSLAAASNANAAVAVALGATARTAGNAAVAGPAIHTGVAPSLIGGASAGLSGAALGSSLQGINAPSLRINAPAPTLSPAALGTLSPLAPAAGLRARVASGPTATAASLAPVKGAPIGKIAPNAAGGVESLGRSAAAKKEGSKSIAAPELDAMFDGAREEDEDAVATAGDGVISGKEAEEDPLDMWFGRAAHAGLMKGDVYKSINLIKSGGSEFYWNKFLAKVPVRILVAGRMAFFTRIVGGETKEIGRLTRKDFEGFYSSRIVNGKTKGKYNNSITNLRNKLLGELRRKAFYADNGPKAITPSTRVRVTEFLSYKEARQFPENNDDPVMEPRPRKEVSVPTRLRGLHNLLPRMVLIDLRLIGDRIPFDLLEDMGKLQKAGVTFVFLSDKSQDEVDKIIVRDLNLKQRDDVVRWKLYSLSNNGNTLYHYGGSFSQLVDSRRFGPLQREILDRAAGATRSAAVQESKAYGLTVRAKRGFLIEEAAAELQANLKRFGLAENDYALTIANEGRTNTITIRPESLATGIDGLIKSMQSEAGIYLNKQHIMTVTQDEAVMARLPGALHYAKMTDEGAKAEDLIETSLAALLGPYRENVRGDLAASASSLKSFKMKYASGGGFNYKVYMLLGHVLHTALDWAVMVYEDTGKLPGKEAVRAKAHEIWRHEDLQQTANLLEHPGETVAGYMEAMDKRLNEMHADLTNMITHYPIVIGTELSNLHVVERFGKDGSLDRRDIFRGLYDLVLAREVEGGLEVVVGDFKTGQTPTIPLLGKDIQVLLYDFFARTLWPQLPVPYNMTHQMKRMVNHITAFIYPSGTEAPEVTEWDRLWYEKFLNLIMNRMRKSKGILTEEQIAKEAKKAENTLKKAEREAKKAAKEAAKK